MTDSQLVHSLHDAVEWRCQDTALFRYVYQSDISHLETSTPYFHPLRTPAGNPVTLHRPHDHAWHKGLAMTCAHLSGQNFWGGPTYVPGQGYIQLHNNGAIEHARWLDLACTGRSAGLREELRWVTIDGETWLHEERAIAADAAGWSAGYWTLDVQFRLQNVRGAPLVFGSPTTQGRPLAGYGSLFWRGPRSFLGGAVMAGGGLEGPGIMGQRAPWLSYTGAHDGSGEWSTLVFVDQPGNPSYPNKWFVRNDPYPAVSLSFMFDEEYTLPPGETLALMYRVVIADGAWTRRQIEALV